jgi:hypothetical protein
MNGSLAASIGPQAGLAWALTGVGLGLLLLGLLFLTRSRWGKARPLSKYVVLSVCAHALLLLAAGVGNLLPPIVEIPAESRFQVHVLGDLPPPADDADQRLLPEPAPAVPPRQPEAEPGADRLEPAAAIPAAAESRPSSPEIPPLQEARQPRADTVESHAVAFQAQRDKFPQHAEPSPVPLDPPRPTGDTLARAASSDAMERPEVLDRSIAAPAVKDRAVQPGATAAGTAGSERVADGGSAPDIAEAEGDGAPQERPAVAGQGTPGSSNTASVPALYRSRLLPDRLREAERHGGSARTERAVRAALAWLARHQHPDGRWDAASSGGGRHANQGGSDRAGAGRKADPAVTGLALLAFLGAGHTHQGGPYQQTVTGGVKYLQGIGNRSTDGSLAGEATHYAAMYCHGIATLALCEAYALTGDHRLRPALRRAVDFTLAAQHPVTGGWRYQPYESGDTSQLGWQLMALTAAHYGGCPVPSRCWLGARRFLQSVSYGNHGGLAAYRPGELHSPAMTAEALLCRLFVGTPPGEPAVQEAANYLTQNLPGPGTANLYYWYYGTLALHHLQGHHWQVWNQALQQQLLQRQESTGEEAGSWDHDTVWGGSGGRVYTTALAAMCLEVYYRYVPLARPVAGTARRDPGWRPSTRR